MKGAQKKAVSRPLDESTAIIHLKRTVGSAQWLEEVHRKSRIAKATLVRRAMTE
jgi:hypothetical protein